MSNQHTPIACCAFCGDDAIYLAADRTPCCENCFLSVGKLFAECTLETVDLREKLAAAEARNIELIDERDEIKHAADLRVISLQSERDELREKLAYTVKTFKDLQIRFFR